MKQILSLVLTWTLWSSAGGIKCETCSSLSCSSNSSQQCSSETTTCFAASAQGSVGPSPIRMMEKGCAKPPICPTSGYYNYSLTTVSVSLMVDVKCCNTDDCNTAFLSFPQTQTDTNLMCCSSADCGATVRCRRGENSCFQAKVMNGSDTGTYFGCASDNLCINVTSQGSFPVISALGNITAGVQCCSTNLCNNVSTIAASSTATPNTTATNTTAPPTAAPNTTALSTAATTTAAMTISSSCSPSLALMPLLLGLCNFW